MTRETPMSAARDIWWLFEVVHGTNVMIMMICVGWVGDVADMRGMRNSLQYLDRKICRGKRTWLDLDVDGTIK